MTGPWWDSGQVFLQSGRGGSAKCLAEALWQMVPWVPSYHWKSMLEPAATGMLLKPGVAFLWLFNLLARCQLLHREEVSD